MAVAA
jgi:hypothetical protein